MISPLIYDAKDPQKRKEVRRGNIFMLVTVFLILLAFSLIASIFVFVFSASQNNHLEVTLSCFFHLVCMSVAVVLFLALLILPTLGKQTMQVHFLDTHFTVISTGPFDKTMFDICYQDVEKVYISKLSKLHIWQKFVGHYSIYYEIRKEKRDGVFRNYKKRLCREFPVVYSLKEAEEVVSYIKGKRKSAYD